MNDKIQIIMIMFGVQIMVAHDEVHREFWQIKAPFFKQLVFQVGP